ncbi:glycerophosphodiester phosphodiesterase [Kurthia huakuii]|uniref:glycerophosphodiester phosphodiesterase n=1 Tax=Kurthia huakuii TaxID=1421019 RepID=UPI00049592FF|nr:glycerophosphodiester phosphodiesterase family protein [Kurthia huakuii]MBM7698059.1 glycerophosphoryl diester phosphodiesterase [Kurthia huakuii]
MSKLPIYAHRGVITTAPENSIAAFAQALLEHADGIEFDVQLTKDFVAIVTHDLNVKRLTGKNFQLNEVPYNQVRTLTVGKRLFKKGTSLLTFDALLAWLIPLQIPVNIELKESFVGQFAAVESIVKKCERLQHVHISSFHEEILYDVKRINPSLETAFIPKKAYDWANLTEAPHIDVVHANKTRYYKARYLQAADDAGKKLRFYNVTGQEKFLTQPHKTVIGWITDYPYAVYQNSVS